MFDFVSEGAWSSITIPSISRRVNGVVPPLMPFIILEARKSGCVPPILPSISRSIWVNELIPGPFQDSRAAPLKGRSVTVKEPKSCLDPMPCLEVG